jgi:N-formylglutamate amidohydrolase
MASRRSAESLFVDSQLGELPLLLTCPHDGRGAPPGVKVRSEEPQPGCGRVRLDADLFTRQITLGLSAAVEDLTARPFSVIARFRRRFIDANRKAKCAFDSKAARPFYDAYHRRITLGIAEIKRTFPNRGLLVDIHGAADQDDPGIHVLLGTDNGNSLKRLLALDPMILWRRGGPVRRLQAAGFGVVPAEAGGTENSSFDGGFTVRRHGAARAAGLDALQVEIVRKVRDDEERRVRLIEALAAGLVSVLRRQARLVQAQG